jgi:hypothetical protein
MNDYPTYKAKERKGEVEKGTAKLTKETLLKFATKKIEM